jgi:hypothetical protein
VLQGVCNISVDIMNCVKTQKQGTFNSVVTASRSPPIIDGMPIVDGIAELLQFSRW